MGRGQATIVRDQFSHVFGDRRGIGGGVELVAPFGTPSSGAGRRELDYILGRFALGEHEPAFAVLKAHADSIDERPLLGELVGALTTQMAQDAQKRYRKTSRDYFSHTELLPSAALCIVKDPEETLHLWADGERYPCYREPSLKKIRCACGKTIPISGKSIPASKEGYIPRARLGEWRGSGVPICKECWKLHNDFPVCTVPPDYDPVPRALAPTYAHFLEDGLRSELVHQAAYLQDERGWVERAERNSVQGALTMMTCHMATLEPYGERALQRILGRAQYNHFYDELESHGHEGAVAPLVGSHIWAEATRVLLPSSDKEELPEPTEEQTEHLQMELSLEIAGQIDTLSDRL